jgi:toxin CptA
MLKKFEPPLILKLKPSKRLKRISVAAHLLALAAGWANALPTIYKIALATAIVAHLYVAVKRLNKRQTEIKYTDASGWEIADDNEFESVTILNSTVLTIYAIWLHVKRHAIFGFFGRANRAILIASDALAEDDYRRLIVKLKTTVNN